MSCNLCHNRAIIKHEYDILKAQISGCIEQKLPALYMRKLQLELDELAEVLALTDDEIVEQVECVCDG